MPPLSCHRIRDEICEVIDTNFEDLLLDPQVDGIELHGPIDGRDFRAVAFVANSAPNRTSWSPFLESGFAGLSLGLSMSPSAVLLVQFGRGRRRSPSGGVIFAFTFGYGGRFLLRPDSTVRGYGLRTALNLIYPRSSDDRARLRGVDTKRRGPTTVRSRLQVSHQADFESFDVNRFRDVVSKATGVPADTDTWGRRVSGGDALALQPAIAFEDLGSLCRRVEAAYQQDDYRDRFDWIDYIQPVTDPILREQLELEVVRQLRARQADNFELAPPEIVDWESVAGFRYHFDRTRGRRASQVTHPDIHLADYLSGLSGSGKLQDIELAYLKSHTVDALDTDGEQRYTWNIWRCLVGELVLHGETFILDESDFYQVRRDYVDELDAAIAAIPTSALPLPRSGAKTTEGEYNKAAAEESDDLLLLDKQLVRIRGRTTAVEICDLLTRHGQLVHVKRHLGSSDLSHLFAQGLVSAELLQTSPEFRREAAAKVTEVAQGQPGFDLFDTDVLRPSDFEVVYAIIEKWQDRHLVRALPFFSKVNLREVNTNLRARGYRVAFSKIDTLPGT